jgi:hypothetical protein
MFMVSHLASLFRSLDVSFSSTLPAASGPECPWYSLARYGPPNVKWCEERLCAVINEPANAWSNLAYVLAGLFLYLTTRRAAQPGKPALQGALAWFPPTIIAVGTCSFIYHASNTYLTQMLDFVGMYLFCFLLLLINAVRLGAMPLSRFGTTFVASIVVMTALTAVVARYGAPIQGFISILTLGIVISEVLCRRRASTPYPMGAFYVSLVLLLSGAVFSALDVSRKWCDPNNHVLQGHAVWHVLSALSLLAAFYHYRQFARAAGGVLLLALLPLFALSGCSPDSSAEGPTAWPVTVGETVQVVPGTALPREFLDERARLAARSNNNLDVVAHNGRVFLATRLAPDHFASDQTSLFIFSSADQASWQFEARFSLGTDLREPRFLSYRGRLFLYFAKLGNNPLGFEPQGMVVSEYRGEKQWTIPAGFYKPDERYIPWRVKERGGRAYLTAYKNGQHIYDFSGQPIDVELLTSDDGLAWRAVGSGSAVVSTGGGSETDFDLTDGGELYAVIRNEAGDDNGWGSKLCQARRESLGVWSCQSDPKKYDSPLVFAYKGELLLIGRRNVSDTGHYQLTAGLPWSATETVRIQVEYSGLPKRCALWRIDRANPEAPRVVHLVDVPGWGDTCFPSLLADAKDGRSFHLYNYSSPLDDPSNADLGWHDAQQRETRIYRTQLTLW